MDIWNTLGIPSTTNLSEIKAAYAKKSRECHPEEHPEEFQKLQTAYKKASAIAKLARAGETAPYAVLNTDTDPHPAENPKTAPPVSVFEQPQDKNLSLPPLRKITGTSEISTDPHTDNTQTPNQSIEPDIKPDSSAAAFDFTQVSESGFIQKQFFNELRLILKNPYLMNHIYCWDVFLHDANYVALYHDEQFMNRLLQTLLSMGAWRPTVVFYITNVLGIYIPKTVLQDAGEEDQNENRRLLNSFLAKARSTTINAEEDNSISASATQKRAHAFWLQYLHINGIRSKLDASRYLHAYFQDPDAPAKAEENIKASYEFDRYKRRASTRQSHPIALSFLILFIIFSFCALITRLNNHSNRNISQQEYERMQNQQQLMDTILEYNERQRQQQQESNNELLQQYLDAHSAQEDDDNQSSQEDDDDPSLQEDDDDPSPLEDDDDPSSPEDE